MSQLPLRTKRHVQPWKLEKRSMPLPRHIMPCFGSQIVKSEALKLATGYRLATKRQLGRALLVSSIMSSVC